jgi:hypothetical protein
MRELFKIIKENLILLLGTGLFTYGLFSFNSGYYIGIKFKTLKTLPLLTPYPISTYYYYDPTDIILLIVGVIFIVIGLIKIKRDKK